MSSDVTSVPDRERASKTAVIACFGSLYFFWGSTYAAIRIGDAYMPPALFAGVRFLIAGAIMLVFCRMRGHRIVWPGKMMGQLAIMGMLLLAGGNLGVVYAEKCVPSGLAALLLAVTPLDAAIAELFLPGGERLARKGWFGLALGIVGLAALVSPSLHAGLLGDYGRLLALLALLLGSFSWIAGGLYSRRTRLPVHPFVAAGWQMIVAGAFDTALGTALGGWRDFHLTAPGMGALAYLITGGSLLGYTSFIYLIEHVPVAKATSYTYVNPVIAVLLGILFLGERPERAEWLGMLIITVAVYLLTTAQMKPTDHTQPVLDLPEPME